MDENRKLPALLEKTENPYSVMRYTKMKMEWMRAMIVWWYERYGIPGPKFPEPPDEVEV